MPDSLYTRLGGYDAIVMFATNLVGQAQQDELLERFWANRGQDRIDRELQLLIDYLVKETGGQMYYTGRDMLISHQGMGITEADWARFLEIGPPAHLSNRKQYLDQPVGDAFRSFWPAWTSANKEKMRCPLQMNRLLRKAMSY